MKTEKIARSPTKTAIPNILEAGIERNEWLPIQYPQPILIMNLELTDTNAMRQLSQRRNAEEYDPFCITKHPFLLPPSVDRFLYSPEAIEDLQEQVQKHQIEDAQIKIIRQSLLCPTIEGVKRCFAPLHVTRSFRYQGLRISGLYFVSMLHNVVATLPEEYWQVPWAVDLHEIRVHLSLQERHALIQYYMQAYLQGTSSCTDLTIIGIPAKAAVLREKSPTHRAFTALAVPCSESNECVISMGGTDMYVFAHNNQVNAVEQVKKLLCDLQFTEKLATFGWSPRIFEQLQTVTNKEMQDPELISLYQQQVYTLLEWIRITWKHAVKDCKIPFI